jgi:hypothetical protein
VPPFRPLPQRAKDSVVHFGKGLLARHVPVIVRPASDNRVELSYEVSGSCLCIRLYDCSDFPQERLHVLAGRLDQDFTVIVTNVLSEKIKSVRDVRYLGFLL